MFSRPNLTEPIATGKYCGLRFKPYEVSLIFPKNCFGTKLNDSKVLETQSIIRSEEERALSPIESRIHGGKDVLYRESPWTVQITTMKMKWLTSPLSFVRLLSKPVYKDWCTGTLITFKHILTAGRCLKEYVIQ